MNDDTHSLNRTPLRNSDLANKPFRSPFSNNTTPTKSNSLKRQHSTSFSCLKTRNQKVVLQNNQDNATKQRNLNVEIDEFSDNSHPTRKDLLALKQRIRSKRLEIDSLKTKLAYRRKHNVKDLRVEMNKWQLALQRALIQYQKDCEQRYTGESTLEMKEVLLMLGIPESVANFPNDVENML